jgi:hypothetical protein
MGLLTKTLRIAHPVRSAKRSVKRAIIPRPVRRALRVKYTVMHPIGSLEYKAIGAVDRAITPKRRSRKRKTTSSAQPKISTKALLTLADYGSRSRAAQIAAARQQLYQAALSIQGVVDRTLAQTTSPVKRQGLIGWWLAFGRSYERIMAGDTTARKAWDEACDRIAEWVAWTPPSTTCSTCGAPAQPFGGRCRYCASPTPGR